MIRVDKIKSSFFGEVGFRNSTVTGYDIVDAANRVSNSGLFFQDVSRLVTIKNIKDTQENDQITAEQFNDLLKQIQDTAILNVCNKVSHKESGFVESVNLFPFEKTFVDTLDTSDRFVGFQVETNHSVGLLSKVNWVELSFDKAVTFNIHLFNSNKPKTPTKTQSVTTVAGESVIKSLSDWYIADNTDFKGGTFYIGYFEGDLNGAKPFKRNYDIANLQIQTRCFDIFAVSLTQTANVIDVSSVVNLSDTGGLNMGVDIYTDYTELFIRNKNLFAQAIQHEMALEALDLITKTTRSNRTERIMQDLVKMVNMELYGYRDDNVFIAGLIAKHGRLISDLRKAFFYQPRISKGTLR